VRYSKVLRVLALAAAALTTTAAHAEWSGMVFERSGIRQASLIGFADNDVRQQIALTCTTTDGIPASHGVSLALPATGEYRIRQGDVAEVAILVGEQRWDLSLQIDTNSSSGLGATANTPSAVEIASLLNTAPAELMVLVSAGPIDRAFSVNADKLGRLATEWIEGCGG
jgi:hypothetical protein